MSKKVRAGKTAKDTPEAMVQAAATRDLPCFITLAEGRRVHWFCPLHETTGSYPSGAHTTDSTELAEAIRKPCEMGLAGRVRQEFEAFHARWPDRGFDTVIDNLESEGVL